ncbi:MAG: nucleotidyltransferase family protein, partial [Elstera sp.]
SIDQISLLDRSLLLELAYEHRLLPPLSGALASSGFGALWPELQAAQQRESVRALHQAAVTLRLLDRFEQAGCRALVLKGQALSAQLYGRADLRMSSDIDFLIDPAMMTKAHDIIVESGYKPLYPVPVENLSYVNKDQVYFRGNTRIELHWRLFDNQSFLPWSFDYLWSNRSFVGLMQSKDIPTLSRDHHILYQALHGLRHGWRRLRWLVDLAIPLQNEKDMENLFSLAKDYNFIPALVHSTLLSQEFLEAPLGATFYATKKQYKSAKRIHFQVNNLAEIRNLKNKNKLYIWIRQRICEKHLDFILCPNLNSIIIEFKQYFIGIGDLIDANLPKQLLWIHIFIRPFLFVRRAFFRYRSHKSN